MPNRFVITYLGGEDKAARQMFMNLCRVAWAINEQQVASLSATLGTYPEEIFEVYFRPNSGALVVHAYDKEKWKHTDQGEAVFHAKIGQGGRYE